MFAAYSDHEPGVTVVLGTGNQEFITMTDILDRVFAHNEVVVLKHHPLRTHLYAAYNIILRPLIRRGFVHAFEVQLYASPKVHSFVLFSNVFVCSEKYLWSHYNLSTIRS